jgi:pyridoxine 4-dehydrogenase
MVVSTTASRATFRAMCASTSSTSASTSKKVDTPPVVQPRAPIITRRDIVLGSALAVGAHTLDTPAAFAAPAKLSDIGTLGLGCWAWGNKLVFQYDESMDDELQRVFNRAVDGGIKLFDSADSYGKDGRSETLLGEFLRECPSAKKDGVILATKLAPYPWRVTSKSFVDAAKSSAKRLGREQIDLGQLHWSTGNYQPLQEGALWAGIADAYDEGVIGAVGLSNYGPKQLRKIHKYMTARGVPISTLQVQYSLLSRFPELNGTKETCDELGIKLIAYSPLALGLLTGKYSVSNPPPGLRGNAYKGVLPGLPTLLETMREVGDAHGGKTPAQVAINWCICKDTVPIPGAKNVRQLEDNLGATSFRLTEGEIDALDRAAEKVGVSVSQNIFQTA